MESKTPICIKSELNLFTQTPVQLGIDASNFIEIFPVTSLNDKSPIEFYIAGNGEHYLDLSHSILNVQVKIVKANGNNLVDADIVAPVNYLMNCFFRNSAYF